MIHSVHHPNRAGSILGDRCLGGENQLSSRISDVNSRQAVNACIYIDMMFKVKDLDAKSIEGICVGGCVRKLSRMVTAIYDRALARAGLKTSQFSVLLAVANRKKARPAELIKALQLDESTLSRNVERMCAKGWLRLTSGDDRRSHLIEVTDKGQALLRKSLPGWQLAQEEITKRLGAENIAALRSALRKLPT